MLKYKKGDLPDMLIFLITMFIFAIGLLIMAFIIPAISDGLNTAGLNTTSEARLAIDEIAELGNEGMQKGFLFLFTGFIMALMISSFLVRTHPIFMFMYILFLGITVFLGTYMGNAFEQITTSPALVATTVDQGLITIVMQNIVVITLVVGALSMIIIFAKFSGIRSGEGGGI
jgi:hypothetical protein